MYSMAMDISKFFDIADKAYFQNKFTRFSAIHIADKCHTKYRRNVWYHFLKLMLQTAQNPTLLFHDDDMSHDSDKLSALRAPWTEKHRWPVESK